MFSIAVTIDARNSSAVPILVHRLPVVLSCLAIVTQLAKWLPVALVPKQLLVASMRNDMINNGCSLESAVLGAMFAPRVDGEEATASFAPTAVITTSSCAFACVAQMLMLFAVPAVC